ncbi:MAG: NACHT domain-containing NTPase [Spirulinaceae cyanobacterium]
MARRSLKASSEGIRKAKQAFERKCWTQEYLAETVGLQTRQPIWKFFSGKPVDRNVFAEICFQLDLELEEIVAIPNFAQTAVEKVAEVKNAETDALNDLIAKVRSERKGKIQDQCGTLRLVDIARPIEIDDLYVNVNILEEITSQRWLQISDLQGFQPEEFDRLGLGKMRQSGVPGLEAVRKNPKLMVLGKPGAGKTTFLQYIAIQCNQGQFLPKQVPVFIRLKNFAEDASDEDNFSFLDYLQVQFGVYDVTPEQVKNLLQEGKVLLLLDGLDEVPENASDEVIKQIRKFSERYYQNNLIITCRIAAQEYRFQGFTEVEIADFSPEQVEAFVQKWFVTVVRNSQDLGSKKANAFLEELNLPGNRQIRELAVTPILLNLTCLVFQAKGELSSHRSDLYRQGLDLLLVRWDETRGIKRDAVYRNLSLPDKLKLLSQLAAITFEQGDYFFEANKVQQLIADYLLTLPNAQTDPVALSFDSSAALKAIEAQHGLLIERARHIYSFSHLTFQEYFTARKIANSTEEESLEELITHLNEKRWREVFLLTTEMLPDASLLLKAMKQKADTNLAGEAAWQEFFQWLENKFSSVDTPYHPAAVRAFYLVLALPADHSFNRNQSLALALDSNIAGERSGDLPLDLALANLCSVVQSLTPALIYNRFSSLELALDLNQLLTDQPILQKGIEGLRKQVPDKSQGKEILQKWWQTEGEAWSNQLISLVRKKRNLCHQWHFSLKQKQLMEQYCQANQLLLDCLNSSCQLTGEAKKEIEKSLFLI